MKELYYGLKDGKLVHISDVQSGLGCDCICPSCGEALIAKKGMHNIYHFAHQIHSTCISGGESALHLMAKSIIADEKKAFIPSEEDDTPGAKRTFASVEIEPTSFNGFIPDIIAHGKERILNIEILVTHAVDNEKLEKIRNVALPTIEIDLSGLPDNFGREMVQEIIFSGEKTKWIYSPRIEERKRISNAKNEICDFIPPDSPFYNFSSENRVSSHSYLCPLLKKHVVFVGGYHSCHECSYYEHNNPNTADDTMPCSYREQNIDISNVTDVKNIKREKGRIIEFDILYNNAWEHWCGFYDEFLSKGSYPQHNNQKRVISVPSGKTLESLWKADYHAMGVQNLITKKMVVINGYNGKMETNMKGIPLGRYYNPRSIHQKYSSKKYPITDFKDEIWILTKKFY